MYYIGQLVAITGAQVPAIFAGYHNKEPDKVWVFFPIEIGENSKSKLDFDLGIEDQVDITPIKESATDTITGERIFFGDYCTYKTTYPEEKIMELEDQYKSYLKKVIKWKCFKDATEDQTKFKRGK